MDAGRRCSVYLCDEPHTARGFCHRHYREFLRKGGERKVQLARRYGLTPEERFWSYVKEGPQCWEWTGYKNGKGYGIINLGGERVMAHRYAYQLVADIPAGMFVCHHCDNPGCVKFRHLFLGTRADNNRDMEVKGRRGYAGMPGEKNHRARLTETDVRAIRASAEPSPVLAVRYGVAREYIWGIRRGLYWKHLE